MKIRDVHAMAMEAALRGWIGPEEIWAVACRWAAQGNRTDMREVFSRILDTDKLKTLSSERMQADTQASVYEGSLPPPSIREPSSPAERVTGPRYTLRERLGSGGVGDVVAALDREIRRVVALK